jgi:cyclic pyranopterin phosphate synthase
MKQLSHVDEAGKARMVDVSLKPDQVRTARASGRISLHADTVKMIRENLIKKGEVLTVAEIAGIQAAKKTSEIIPLCHPLLLTGIKVRISLEDTAAVAVSEVSCIGQTGVEMEALTAVSTALLTVYDMCKAVDKNMLISEIQLIEKEKHDLP